MKKLFAIAILATSALLTSCSKTQEQIDKKTAVQMVKDVVGDKFKLESVKSYSFTIADEINSASSREFDDELSEMMNWSRLTPDELDSLFKLEDLPELKPKVSYYYSNKNDRYSYVVEYRVEGIKKEMIFIKFNPTKYDKDSLWFGELSDYESESLIIKIKKDNRIDEWKKLNGEFPIITLLKNFEGKYYKPSKF